MSFRFAVLQELGELVEADALKVPDVGQSSCSLCF